MMRESHCFIAKKSMLQTPVERRKQSYITRTTSLSINSAEEREAKLKISTSANNLWFFKKIVRECVDKIILASFSFWKWEIYIKL